MRACADELAELARFNGLADESARAHVRDLCDMAERATAAEAAQRCARRSERVVSRVMGRRAGRRTSHREPRLRRRGRGDVVAARAGPPGG